jgi:hypothetical protein
MIGVDFIYFPQPKKDKEKCLRWVKACGRPTQGPGQFHCGFRDEGHVDYICTKHFVDEKDLHCRILTLFQLLLLILRKLLKFVCKAGQTKTAERTQD